jgi:protein TonB
MSGDQGTAIVYFVINRFGTVLMFRMEKRTGSSSLDAEVKRMMRRIQQFPAVPDDEFVGKDRIEFTVPIGFKLED